MNEAKSSGYRRRRRRTAVLRAGASAALLAALAGSGLSRTLADVAARAAALAPVPDLLQASLVVAGYTLVVSLAGRAIDLPLAWYGEFVLDRRFGVSRRHAGDWLCGYAGATVVRAAAWTAGAVFLYAAMRGWPASWWLAASLAAAVLTVVATHLAPLVLPWLYHLRPLERPALRRRLEALVRRAGAAAIGIHEWRLGADPPRPNAALVGIGSTRRVLLTDALLADYSDDEIEVVVAHELAHHVHRDVWKTMACETLAAAVACGAAHWALHSLGPRLGLAGVADVAGLPIAVLAAGAALLLLAPLTNLMSRRLERRADRYAVDLTGKPEALASGLRRLAAQSLAEERPSRVTAWLSYSHPPWSDRLVAAVGAVSPGASPARGRRVGAAAGSGIGRADRSGRPPWPCRRHGRRRAHPQAPAAGPCGSAGPCRTGPR